MKYHLFPERRHMLQSPQTKPRKSTVGTLYAVGGMDAMRGTPTVEKYDLRTNSWQHCGTMSNLRVQFGVAVINNKLYVLGGGNDFKTLNIVECFDPDSKIWTVMPPMLTARYALGVLRLTEDTTENLLDAACLLQLTQVIEVCSNFLIKQLHPSNCLGILSFGDARGCTELLRVAHKYTMLLADLEDRPVFTADLECQKLLIEAMKYHLLPERRHMLQSPRTKPRKSTVGALYAVGGMDAMRGNSTIEIYDIRTNSWQHCSSMSNRRLHFGVAVINNKLYVLGGIDDFQTLNTVECFDPASRIWTVMPPMSTPRHGLGAATLEGPMYAVGGHDGSSILNTVERWDPEGRQWTYVANMSTRRGRVGVVALNGKIYAIGGFDGRSCLKSMECFDPHTNKWRQCASMSNECGHVGAATYSGLLYVVGGHDSSASNQCTSFSNRVERYNPKTDSWSAVAPLRVPRYAIAICPLGDRLYVVGGYDGQSYLNTVESYDAQKDEWREVLTESNKIGMIGINWITYFSRGYPDSLRFCSACFMCATENY
nr:kelch-like protein 4 [Manis javanica]